jgi:hypothetical protein
MAVTVAIEPGGPKAKRWLVTFGLDADTTVTIPHGFNGIPDHVEFYALNALAVVPGAVSRGTVDGDNIVMNKLPAVGSGGAQVELIAYIPNSSL